MKNLFGVYKDETFNNFNRFISKKISSESEKAFANMEKDGKTLKHKKLPSNWLGQASILLFMFGLLSVVSMLSAEDGFLNALQTRGAFFYIGIGMVILGVSLFLFYRIKSKKSETDPEVVSYVEKANHFLKERYFELGIPESARDIDVIFSPVIMNKKGEEKNRPGSFIQYVNLSLKVYAEKDSLCFGYSTMVISIPLSSLQKIFRINKSMPLPQWHKKTGFKSEEYKKYKISANGNGLLWTKPYFRIESVIENDEYFFLLPCYEMDGFISVLDGAGIHLDISNG